MASVGASGTSEGLPSCTAPAGRLPLAPRHEGETAVTGRSATIVAGMSMSVDGFVAGPSDEVDRLFAWYANLSEASGILLQEAGATLRAIINGRRTFDIAGGWGGKHPLGVPVSWPRILRQPQGTPIELDGPRAVEGNGVTHLSYSVKAP